MIDGLKLDFTAAELDVHLASRISHHNERASFYLQQARQLREGGAKAQQYTNGDPVRSLDESAKQHGIKAEKLQVIREHLVANETYRLEDKDLFELEYLSRGY